MWRSKTQTTAAVKRVQREFSHNFPLPTLPAFTSSFAMVTEARGKPKFLKMQRNKTEIQNKATDTPPCWVLHGAQSQQAACMACRSKCALAFFYCFQLPKIWWQGQALETRWCRCNTQQRNGNRGERERECTGRSTDLQGELSAIIA